MEYIRIWSQVDISGIENELLIVDDKFGFCPGCKEMGIKLDGLKNCPKCNRKFRYAISREARGGPNDYTSVMRIMKKLPEMIIIDYNDFERIKSKKNAEGLFSGI